MNSQVISNSGRFGGALERAGEWFNPLLVKECRQSLKSRQFSTTFTLVVVLSWLWTIYGIAMLGADVAYRADGAEMFYGYYVILAVALVLVVPNSAFRSLIAEREDNTFELVAITTLRPRQIVGGKLGSAVAQMLVFLSVIAPCLAFTYMLHGIDVLTICWILFYTVLASLGLSLAAVLLATIAKERHWQVVVSVLLILGLFYAFLGLLEVCHGVLRVSRLPFQSQDFWVNNLKVLTAYGSMFALLYLAAGAQLTSAAENRSTPLRIAMLVQQGLLAAWIGFDFADAMQFRRGMTNMIIDRNVLIYIVISILYWFGAGGLMIGEATELSSRAKRSLPTSFLGRVFLTWFNPGPDTGYLFAVGNGIAAAALALIALFYIPPRGTPNLEQMATFVILAACYLVIYLGVSNILMHWLRRVTTVSIATTSLITELLLLTGIGIPFLIRYLIDYRGNEYTLLHVSDPFWSCFSLIDPRYAPVYVADLRWIVLPIAGAVLLINLFIAVPATAQVRVARPKRVEEEEELRRQELQESKPESPWG